MFDTEQLQTAAGHLAVKLPLIQAAATLVAFDAPLWACAVLLTKLKLCMC